MAPGCHHGVSSTGLLWKRERRWGAARTESALGRWCPHVCPGRWKCCNHSLSLTPNYNRTGLNLEPFLVKKIIKESFALFMNDISAFLFIMRSNLKNRDDLCLQKWKGLWKGFKCNSFFLKLLTMEYPKPERTAYDNNQPSPTFSSYHSGQSCFICSVAATHHHPVDYSAINPRRHIISSSML